MKIASAMRGSLCCVIALMGLTTAARAQELNWAQKMFEAQSIDFGTIARGAEAQYRLKVTNLYKQTVHIANVRTTCGCSAAKPSKSTLASREEAYIEVTMDTRKFSHRKDSNVIVTFDAPLYQEVRIPITAYIRTDVVFSPGSADFGSVDLGSGEELTVDVAYAGRSDWTIRDVEAHSPYLTAKATEVDRGNGHVNYELHITLKPDAPVGVIRDQLTLLTDDANSPKVPLLVEARIAADITVTPGILSLGTLAPGQTKPVNVVLRGKKPFAIEKIECGSADEAFKVRLPKDAKPVHVLPMTFTAPDEPGKFTEEFIVTIAGRPEPVTFKAYATISPN